MTVAEPVIPKRVILSMGGKGGVGKTNVMTGLAEWFAHHQISVTLLDLDTENKTRGSLSHFFDGAVPKINIHTPEGLDAFLDYLDAGPPIVLADMGSGTANRREAGFHATNGEIVTVSQVDNHGRIHLEDGRQIPASYKHVDYGYAVTAHRSQGQSVDAVVIAGETLNRELFHVAASRGREQLTVITSDKARLQESVGRSGARLSASELVRAMHATSASGVAPEASRGFERAIRTVVQTARQSVGFEQDSHGHAVPAPVQQATHAVDREPAGPTHQLERGQSHGISR